MFAPIKRLIFDIRFYIQEWKTQWNEADEIDLIEEENRRPMAGFVAYKEMQRRHTERVQQHKLDRAKIK
ncbi:MAG: hypothetical protein MJZ65_04535 [Paludibacteraceae bacterium]|nr:hypothetical protein [Paludibacteraceae bacterium]